MLCVLGCSGFAWAGLGCVLISRLLVLGFEVFVRRVRADGGTDMAPILLVRRPWSYPCVVLGRVWVVFLVCFRPAGGGRGHRTYCLGQASLVFLLFVGA